MIQGQIVIGPAELAIGDGPGGDRAILIAPHGTALQIVIPLSDQAAAAIATELRRKRVAMPSSADVARHAKRNGRAP